MLAISSLALSLLALHAKAQSPQELAASYGLTTTKVLQFPPSPIGNDSNAAATFITTSESWSTSFKKINNNPQNIQFVADPFPNSPPSVSYPGTSPSNSSATVLAITYPQGSYNHDTGGTQFNQLFEPSGKTQYKTLALTYEVAFDQNFQFAKGGKLPGLRGGEPNGCSGGKQPTGDDCFSVRLMWRPNGLGEVYAYIPTPNDICGQENVRCNSDGFGTSVSRGTFEFVPGRWTRITMLISLNNPNLANGELRLYFNDLIAIRMQNVYFRATENIASVTGMYFSTFFGGNDPSWASPVTQHTYYRNIQMWASTSPSNVTDAQPVRPFSSASSQVSSWGGMVSWLAAAMSLWLIVG